ncbi:MAG: amino acid ABC transporter permease [Inquilinus limosus]|uniref:Amino acid ABC transporter permease n=1 Tax=Inquilinus limosus TaxID=171674 RepID=A0A952FTL6_9PROT|nr:amino acid ABC transporter permease [Inquilinus limosus]
MYADKVEYPRISTRPAVFLALALGLFLVFWACGLKGTWLGQIGVALIGETAAEGWAGNVAAAAVITLAMLANFYIIVFLPRVWQIGVIWTELMFWIVIFFRSFDLSLEFVQRKIGFLITQGVTTTLYVSAASIAIAFVLAMAGAIAKLSRNGIAFALATFYTSIFRGLPLLMQVYIIYMGLPQLGYVVQAVPAGIAALSLCYGAYMTEIFRAGIESIPRGQWEAARALGLAPHLVLRKVILPQAMRVIIPPTGNQFIAMLKDSTLVSVIGVWELMYLARTQGQTEFRHVEMLITASAIYWLMSIVLELGQAKLERSFNRVRFRG